VIKADGYGHGGIAVAEALSQLGVRRFGVATVQEGVLLREAGILEDIIVMGGILPGQVKDLVQANLIPTLSDADTVHALSREVSLNLRPYPVHVEVDTGMRRLGFASKEVLPLLQSPMFSHTLVCQGLMTHLADADNPDPTFTLHQLDQFHESVSSRHAANTAGILWHPQAQLDMVRPGLLLYGYTPVPDRDAPVSLQPVMSLKTKVVHLKTAGKGEPVSYGDVYRTRRDSRLAILPIGYAHGYNRRLSNTGEVIIHDRRFPIVGRICMDMTVVDVTDGPTIKPGDDVILMGKSENQEITAYDLANWQDSIPYEVLCNLGAKVTRVYEPLELRDG
jgi:alanine racemase